MSVSLKRVILTSLILSAPILLFLSNVTRVTEAEPPPPLELFDGPNEATFTRLYTDKIHVCPEGYALRGIDISKDRFLCRRTQEAVTDYFIDYGTQRQEMHVCPDGTYIRGIRVDKNLFVCAYDRRRGYTEFSGEEEDRCPESAGKCSQQDNKTIHICIGNNLNWYMTGFNKDANTFKCRQPPESPTPIPSPVEINLKPSQLRSYMSLKGGIDLQTWQRATRNWLARILNVPTNGSYRTAPSTVVVNEHIFPDSIRQQTLRITSPVDGSTIMAYLTFPSAYKPNGSYPAVLVTHGHFETHKEGTGNPKYLKGKPDWDPNHALAYYLAQQGAITLAPDTRTFEAGQKPHYTKTANYPYIGDYPQWYLRDNLGHISLLSQVPGVNQDQISVTGLSLGGFQAMWLAAMDTRVSRVVVAGLFLGQRCLDSDASPDYHHYCQTIPALSTDYILANDQKNMIISQESLLIDTEDIAALIAPRPLLVTWGKSDDYYKKLPNSACMTSARDKTIQLYKELGIPTRFSIDPFEGGHETDPDATATWLFKMTF